jgi:hypothetical protein
MLPSEPASQLATAELCPQDRFCLWHRLSEFTRSHDCVSLHDATMPKCLDRIWVPMWEGSSCGGGVGPLPPRLVPRRAGTFPHFVGDTTGPLSPRLVPRRAGTFPHFVGDTRSLPRFVGDHLV